MKKTNETTSAGNVAAVSMPMGSIKKRNMYNKDGTMKNALDTNISPISGKYNKSKDPKMKKKTNENLADMAHMTEQDHEVQMARADLYKIAKYALKLHDLLKGVSEQQGLQGWQQAKITKASDYISSVFHNLEYELKIENSATIGESKKKEKTKTNHKKGMHSKLSKKVEENVNEKWKGDAEIEQTGEYEDRPVESLRKEYKKLKDTGPHAKGSDDYEKMREIAFAIRAKTGWGKVEEKITKDMSAGEIISDFQKSDDPKFDGKSKEERKRMALGAYYAKHPEKSKKKVEENDQILMTEEQFDEAAGEKDACYHKVKSRYKVWPSAYASGALVQCRKVGAKNWGNKSKK